MTAQMPRDVGLVRALGLVVLVPVVRTATEPGAVKAAAGFGLLALAVHLVSLSGRPAVAGRWAAVGLAALTMACGYAGHLVDKDSWVLVAVAAALQVAVRVDPLPAAIAGIALCTLAAPAYGLVNDPGTSAALVAGPGLVAALRHRLLVTIAELHATREQLAVAAVRKERDRFSDDLHDLLGHSLSVIVVSAQVIQKVAATRPEQAADTAAEIEAVGRRALDDVRAAVLGYRTRSYAMESAELQRALRSADITPDFEADPPTLPDGVDATLALVLRESVTNVVRHSRATTCSVRLTVGDGIELAVRDDGDGDLQAARRADAGLATVRARLAEHGGMVRVEPVDPHGLRVTAVLP